MNQDRHRTLNEAVRAVLARKEGIETIPLKEQLSNVQEKLMAVIETGDERVALSQYLHQTVQHHVRHLEDEICCFEEEVRLARTYGELVEENITTNEPVNPEDKKSTLYTFALTRGRI